VNVLIINQFASTPEYSTGAGERFYYLGKEFKKKGINSKIISASYNHLFVNSPKVKGLYRKDENPEVNFIWLKTRAYTADSNFGRVFAFFDFLFKLFLLPIKKREKPDVVIVSSMSIFPVFYAGYLKWKLKIPFILEVRDIWPLTPIELGGFSKKHAFMRLLEYTANYGYKSANYIVSVLPGFDEFLKTKGFLDKPFKWIPNGIVDLKDFKPPLSNSNNDDFIIIYAGAMGKANALEYFIQSARLLKRKQHFKFWVLGDGPEKEELIQTSKDLPNVIFKDKVEKSGVIQFLSQADCCFIGWRDKELYKYGVSANKYNDYMLAGKSILSSSNIPNDPVVMADCGLQVPAESAEAIAKGIIKISKISQSKRQQWAKNGHNYVRENTNYSILAERYLEVFNGLGLKK
jgi:glycosyltransferase involved in cell wall biosynthesis